MSEVVVEPVRVTPDGVYIGGWTLRRRMVAYVLAFCALVVGYCVVLGSDTAVQKAAVDGSFILAGVVVTNYIVGAAWDDKNIRDGSK